ncbi:2-succinyl-5-enolpyruvyl-6-hydroxy-3-cyclohexene -1-carboxylatesynthase [Emticicia oligotrophica DSM 17448]|uniref:2-succinyl-5-enolpyruvyl-6-hydroxy-3-cyclohexene-1-carboxylate synthase n=1 Tax=Emticicia oligotrophica (strain DSM 17448 / CIP 109782 / MTCC 6937 / GPTSA100-15) TaxID=929562 RepID=A0ABM5N720_EMTOG|nr:2-succinyl-5-enolpyruvyl-6-hydroxy-3-cyclohexene-1-carboxylic-acid synthase [Emticicia oligotrophica]AFK05314.1 2-succinyl-5-enolpyruvyl-6-hydroxy-3-cyclohexene -1-carboxylatesynthase [Emticicia oligotrophica DSM 17448]
MAILQPIHNIAEILAQKNVKTAILCPGSRSAALTISLVRHPEIQTYSISDERSAAFIGLGMAQQTGDTVALICTSGTAAYNFAPAVAEAYFQEIPLLVMTADRPAEWIHQYDGQTIYQREIYGKHVKKAFELPSDYTHSDSVWQIERVVNEAVNLSQIFPKGPVHINVPIREPFYPTEMEKIEFDRNVRIIKHAHVEKKLSNEFWCNFKEIWESIDNKLIIVGHQHSSKRLNIVLEKFVEELGVPVVADIISNVNSIEPVLSDVFLSSKNENLKNNLKPDLLITIGKSVISKNLKIFIRNNKPKFHFHIQENGDLIDPFQTLTDKVEVSPEYFFEQLFEDLDIQNFKNGDEEIDFEFLQQWCNTNERAKKKLNSFIENLEYSEFKVIKSIIDKLPENSIFHLANSMVVRYANLIGIEKGKNIEIFANRGTSGIDGSLSSAIGVALKTNKIVTCLIGDMSFFYDRNGFWNTYLPDNLRVIVINNHGGNIFRIIDGPNKQPEVKEYFETIQSSSAKYICEEANVFYHQVNDEESLLSTLNFLHQKSERPILIEVEIDGNKNAEVFASYKKLFAEFV